MPSIKINTHKDPNTMQIKCRIKTIITRRGHSIKKNNLIKKIYKKIIIKRTGLKEHKR